VIKEISVVTTITADTRSAARVLALALVQVLALGLPDPGYITVSPWAADSPYVSSIDFQFDGDGEAAAVQDWADRFGVTVTCRPDSKDPARCWVSAEFTYLDVRFKVYAHTGADET
jgi:hypothetical protein